MSVMISSQRQPSVHALMCLYFKLNEQADLLHDDNIEVLYQTRCKLLSISEEVMKTVQEKCK